MSMTLEEVRRQIDVVDTQMKPLFLSRMECAKNVAIAKSKTGGNVFVPSREREIIAKRTEDAGEVKAQYTEFLRHLMTMSRVYQYGFLTPIQEEVLAGATQEDPEKVKVTFTVNEQETYMNLFLNVLQVNGIVIEEFCAKRDGDKMLVSATLRGSLKTPEMRRAMSQIGKEAYDLTIR